MSSRHPPGPRRQNCLALRRRGGPARVGLAGISLRTKLLDDEGAAVRGGDGLARGQPLAVEGEAGRWVGHAARHAVVVRRVGLQIK